MFSGSSPVVTGASSKKSAKILLGFWGRGKSLRGSDWGLLLNVGGDIGEALAE
jgi:hypothetical protein